MSNKEYTMVYNDKKIKVKDYFGEPVISIDELTEALKIKLKSVFDTVNNEIPQKSVVSIPIEKKSNLYYLKRPGIIKLIGTYKTDDLYPFMEKFDAIAEQIAESVKEEKKDIIDPYAVDLLEDILREIKEKTLLMEKAQSSMMALQTKMMIMMLEMEVLYSRTFAMLLRSESFGPIARLNKEFTKDLIGLGKELLTDSDLCEKALNEYTRFNKDEDEAEEKEMERNSLLIMKNKGGK